MKHTMLLRVLRGEAKACTSRMQGELLLEKGLKTLPMIYL